MSIYLVDFENTVTKHFKDNITDALTRDTKFDNDPTQMPEDKIWIRWTHNEGASSQSDIGCNNPRFRTTGSWIAMIMGILKTGSGDATALAVQIKTLYRNLSLPLDGEPLLQVEFREPTIVKIGERGSRYQVNVSCPYRFDETNLP